MNSNHFDPKSSYNLKLFRLKRNIQDLQEAAMILDSLPLKAVQGYWRVIAQKDLPQKNDKNKPINKGPYKQCLKKTIQAFLVEHREMKSQLEERIRQIDHRSIDVEDRLMNELKEIVKRGEKLNSCGE